MFNGDPSGRLDTTTLASGGHTLTATAYGSDGKSTSKSISVTVANAASAPTSGGSAPQVSISQPANGQTLSGSVAWVATASGASVARIAFAVDGVERWTEKTSPYMFNGDPSGRLDTTTLASGGHTLTATAYGSDGKSTSKSISVTVANSVASSTGSTPAPSGSVSPSSGVWKGWSAPAILSGAIAVTSSTSLASLLRSCPKPGAVYDATRLNAVFADRVIVDARCPDGRSQTFFLGPNVRFASSGLTGDPAVDVTAAQNVVIYGGDVSNPVRGYGIVVRGYGGVATRNVRWWGFKVHDTGQTGLLVHQMSGAVQAVDLRGDISRWSLNLSLDPHNAKGTGLHGAYIGVSSSGSVSNSTFVLNVHDAQYGSGVQLGPNLQGDEVQVRAANLSCNPPSGADGTCGNALTVFGSGQSNVVISDVEASNIRRGVEGSGLSTSVPTASIRVTHGRVTNARMAAYDYSRVGILYTDCS